MTLVGLKPATSRLGHCYEPEGSLIFNNNSKRRYTKHNLFYFCSQVFGLGGNIANLKAARHIVSQPYMNDPHGSIPQEEVRTPTTPQSSNHIALHLVSKVLEDESIFNFTSFEETTPCVEPCSPVSCVHPDR